MTTVKMKYKNGTKLVISKDVITNLSDDYGEDYDDFFEELRNNPVITVRKCTEELALKHSEDYYGKDEYYIDEFPFMHSGWSKNWIEDKDNFSPANWRELL